MLAQLLAGLGIRPEQLQSAQHALVCLAYDFRRLARSLQFEYGVCTVEATPHNPANLPHVEQVELAAGERRTIDLERELGKPATRGHVVNLSDDVVRVRWHGVGDATGASGEYHLLPQAAVDTSSFIVRKVELAGDDDEATSVQIFAQ